MEKQGDHGGCMDVIQDDQGLGLGKEEREKQNGLKAKVSILGPFCFCTQDTIEGVSDLGSIAELLRGKILLETSIIMCPMSNHHDIVLDLEH